MKRTYPTWLTFITVYIPLAITSAIIISVAIDHFLN